MIQDYPIVDVVFHYTRNGLKMTHLEVVYMTDEDIMASYYKPNDITAIMTRLANQKAIQHV